MPSADAKRRAEEPLRYFSHDSDAASDVKCRRLIKRLGMEGYGRWWRLCELLASADGHRIDTKTDEDFEILADELFCDSGQDAVSFLESLSGIGLIAGYGTGQIWSERMDENALYFGTRRAAAARGGKAKKDAR